MVSIPKKTVLQELSFKIFLGFNNPRDTRFCIAGFKKVISTTTTYSRIKKAFSMRIVIFLFINFVAFQNSFGQNDTDPPAKETQEKLRIKGVVRSVLKEEIIGFYPYFQYKADFSATKGGYPDSYHKEVGLAYMLFNDNRIYSELKFSVEEKKEIQKQCALLGKSWAKNRRQLAKTGDITFFQQYLLDAKEFDFYVSRKVDTKKRKENWPTSLQSGVQNLFGSTLVTLSNAIAKP